MRVLSDFYWRLVCANSAYVVKTCLGWHGFYGACLRIGPKDILGGSMILLLNPIVAKHNKNISFVHKKTNEAYFYKWPVTM